MIAGIMACDQKGGIGKNNSIPWKSPRDMAHFKSLTTGHNILMGRKTWDSLPNGPLPGRKNWVITSERHDEYEHAFNLEGAEEYLEECKDAFVIGGATIYKALEKYIDYWYITVVEGDFGCNTRFAPDLSNFEKVSEVTVNETDGRRISFKEYRRKNRKGD